MTSLGRAFLIVLAAKAFGCAGAFDPPVEYLVFTEGEYRDLRIGESKSDVLQALRGRKWGSVSPSDVGLLLIQPPKRDEAELLKGCDRWEVFENFRAGSKRWRAQLTFRADRLSEIHAEEWMGERWVISTADLPGCS